MVKSGFNFILILCLLATTPRSAYAVPGVGSGETAADSPLSAGSLTSVENLLSEADTLIRTGHPIDGRAKLLQAVKLAPKDYRPHMELAQYYLFHVSHFKLAYRYIVTAERLFRERHGSVDMTSDEDGELLAPHIRLLYLLSEAQLNLDKYKDSLKTLDRFDPLYRGGWYPGTRAWVLMKLKRIDEAIEVAQEGLRQGADPRRTWNILGILMSVSGNRRLSLHAFQQAIIAELSVLGSGLISTPLNNAGEVYREMFEDGHAEAAWLRALRLPDGCDHVLPSLNLTHVYIDQLRLYQAERILKDFEVCFAQQPLRKDSEHRTLLALARGKIALHENRLEDAIKLIGQAAGDQQWFGKIGTNENDVKFAAQVSLAQAYQAKAAALRDTVQDSWYKAYYAGLKARMYEIRARWLNHKARRIGFEELHDLEDLFIRNTDAMIQYPTLGSLLATYNTRSLSRRIKRMIKEDNRSQAHLYYRLYLASNLVQNGEEKEAIKILEEILPKIRPYERLMRAEALAKLITAKEQSRGWFSGNSKKEKKKLYALLEELYETLPSHLRFHNLRLPIRTAIAANDSGAKSHLKTILSYLPKSRFEVLSSDTAGLARYELTLSSQAQLDSSGKRLVSLHFSDKKQGTQKLSQTSSIGTKREDIAKFLNEFIAKAFSHRVDPQGEPVPELPLLKGILDRS